MSDRILIRLNDKWLLGHDGRLQWIIGTEVGQKNRQFVGQHFCGTKAGLEQCLGSTLDGHGRKPIGPITAEARTFVDSLPDLYRQWREAGFPGGGSLLGVERVAVEPLSGVRVADGVQSESCTANLAKTAA